MNERELMNSLLAGAGGGGGREVQHKDVPLDDINDPLLELDDQSVMTARQRMKQRANQMKQNMAGPPPGDMRETQVTSGQMPANPRVVMQAPNQQIQNLQGQIEFLKLRLGCAETHLKEAGDELFKKYKNEWLEIMLEMSEDDLMAVAGQSLLKKKQEQKVETNGE